MPAETWLLLIYSVSTLSLAVNPGGISRMLVGLSLTRLCCSRRNEHTDIRRGQRDGFKWFPPDAKSRPELYCATTGGLLPPQLASAL
jgi:hypothetical protein